MRPNLKYALILVLPALLFFPFLGGLHLFDWDEINFAECAREMMVSGDYLRPQIDFMPFWEKPPFFIWLQVLAMKVFGVGEFAARFPDALIGVLTIMAVFYTGKRIVNEKLGMWWAALFMASWLPHLYFKSGIIDPVFNFFIFLAFVQVHFVHVSPNKWRHAMLAGLLLGMAALTKGPVAGLVALLAMGAYIVMHRGLNGYKLKHLFCIFKFATFPVAIWVGVTAATHGMEYTKWFVTEFFTYQVRLFSTEDSDHGGPFIYHFIVLLAGCFPASVFLFQYIGGRRADKEETPVRHFSRWMWLLFWVVLILFSIVKTKIVHYSSLCYFPLTFLAAMQLYRMSEEGVQLKKGVKATLLALGTLLAIVITALPVVGINRDKLAPYIADPFAVANLRAAVDWSYAECGWGLLYLIGIWVAVMMMRTNFRKGMIVLCVVQVVVIQAVILHFTPKVEAFSQRAAIDYYQQFAGQDVYVQPLGYKSYANLFYTRKRPSTAPEYTHIRTDNKGRKTPEANEHWLLFGKPDKPVYFICRIQDSVKYREMQHLEYMGGSNGFLFFRRKAEQ